MGLRSATIDEVTRILLYARRKNKPILMMDCEEELRRRSAQGRTEEDRRDARRAENYLTTRPRKPWVANG